MSSTNRYIDPDYWVEIERGRVFEAAMYYLPSSTSRPLRIVRRVGKSEVKISLEEMHDFSPSYANGRPVENPFLEKTTLFIRHNVKRGCQQVNYH